MYRHRQLHLWITEHDYSMLRELAEERRETLSAVVRRFIKLHYGEIADVLPEDGMHADGELQPERASGGSAAA